MYIKKDKQSFAVSHTGRCIWNVKILELLYRYFNLSCIFHECIMILYALKGTIEFGPEVTGKQQSAKLLLNSDDAVSQKLYFRVSEFFFFQGFVKLLDFGVLNI